MRDSFFDRILIFFKEKSTLSLLILINIFVFIIINLIMLFSKSFGALVLLYVSVSSNTEVLSQLPWTIFTYMFVQYDFFHILFNMYMLYLGGKLFSDYLGSKRLLATYILGGIIGALFYIIAFNVFPVFDQVKYNSIALGASASVLAVFIATAYYLPNHKFYLMFIGAVKLKHIAIVFILIDILSISRNNPGGHIAHLGGAFYGFIYIWLLKKGTDINEFFVFILKKIESLFYKPVRPKMKINVQDTKTKTGRPLSDEEYLEVKAQNQKKMDAILDKISKSGYESLSKEEKELLFRMSNED